MNRYAVIIETHADRSLTDKQIGMLTASLAGPGKYNAAICYEVVKRFLLFRLCVEAPSMADAVTEALRVTERAARVANFGFEAEEVRALPSARVEEETARLLAASQPVPSSEEAAAADDLTALTEELGLYGKD